MADRPKPVPYWKMDKIAREIGVDWRTVRKVIKGERVRGSRGERVADDLRRRGIQVADVDDDGGDE